MQDNHIYTSGATGTNAAVIRGALRAEKPHLLTVVLPQSRHRQPPESQELLEQAQPFSVAPCREGHSQCTGSFFLMLSTSAPCRQAVGMTRFLGCRCRMLLTPRPMTTFRF